MPCLDYEEVECSECHNKTQDGYDEIDGKIICDGCVKEQILPCPDEAPLTWCPWCGKEINVSTTNPKDEYDELSDEKSIYRHKSCGKLVKFKSWSD